MKKIVQRRAKDAFQTNQNSLYFEINHETNILNYYNLFIFVSLCLFVIFFLDFVFVLFVMFFVWFFADLSPGITKEFTVVIFTG